ncbi:MAG: hypothetical protein MJZ22_01465 [Candidatus Saccharibacteria bacterium]|nr:hypothetical protein [Candidatus Saccharibacteria bacterium]
MYRSDYLECAKKHKEACISAFAPYLNNADNAKSELLLELYYIIGYIVEGCVFYSTFIAGGFPPLRDVTDYDHNFTMATKIDFYDCRKSYLSKEHQDCRDQLKSRKQLLYLTGHNFQSIVDNYLSSKAETMCWEIPYINKRVSIDCTAKDFIENWKPELRYSTMSKGDFALDNKDLIKKITFENIKKLAETAFDIVDKTIEYVQPEDN